MPEASILQTELSVSLLNRELEGYIIVREVGHGAMGVVYEARQEGVERRVAIKVLPPNMALRERTVKRFLREAEAMGRLSHPNIVDIHEVGSRRSLHYFSMRFVEGPPLDRVLRAGPMAIGDVLQIGIDVASALAHAHSRGVLHRDVKPSNLLRDGERVVLTDFGLARPIDNEDAGSMTESGDLVGTPLYMSPEQISGDGELVDARSDVWGLGATLYELLSQKPPFPGANAQSILNSILHKEPQPLRRLRDDVPRDLEAILLKCLEKNCARRYPTAAGLVEDLDAFREGRPVSARPRRFYDPAVRWVRRHPVEAGVALSALVLIGWLGQRSIRSEQDMQTAIETGARATQETADLKRAMTLGSARAELLQAERQWQSGASTQQAELDRFESLIESYREQAPELSGQLLQAVRQWQSAGTAARQDALVRVERLIESYSAEFPEPSTRLLQAARQWHGAGAAAQQEALDRVELLIEVFADEYPEITVEAIGIFASWTRKDVGARGEALAIQKMEALIAQKAQDPLAVRAALYTGLDRFPEALRVHAERVIARPLDPEPFLDAGRLHRRLSQIALEANDLRQSRVELALAFDCQQRALQLAVRGQDEPNTIAALIEQARCFLDLQLPTAAQQNLELVLARDQTRAEAHALLAAAKRAQVVPADPASGAGVAATDVPAATDIPASTPEDLIEVRRTEFESAGRNLQSILHGLREVLTSSEGDEVAEPATTGAQEKP